MSEASEEPQSAKPKRNVVVPKVKVFVQADELKRDVRFSPNDLSNAMVEQGALFVHYGIQAALASKQVDDLKLLLENQEARAGREIRDRLTLIGEKFTESSIAGRVAREPQIVTTKRAVNEAKQIEAVAKAAMEAFRHRRDMLVQMGLISREEMKGEASISRQRAVEAERESALERQMSRFRAKTEPEDQAA